MGVDGVDGGKKKDRKVRNKETGENVSLVARREDRQRARSEGGRTRERPEGARFNTSSLVRAFTLTSDRQIKLNDTRIVKGRRRSATTDG